MAFSEAFLFPRRDGRLLAMIRSGEGDSHLYRSVSSDGGRTWSPIERTAIWGLPAHVIRLRSGALLCAYAHRRHPEGFRAVLSDDDGDTWDVEHEKVLRDAAVGSVGYPFSVQLADGTIFTACELGKPVREEPAGPAGGPRAGAGGPPAHRLGGHARRLARHPGHRHGRPAAVGHHREPLHGSVSPVARPVAAAGSGAARPAGRPGGGAGGAGGASRARVRGAGYFAGAGSSRSRMAWTRGAAACSAAPGAAWPAAIRASVSV